MAILLIIADRRTPESLQTLRSALVSITLPIHYLAHFPQHVYQGLNTYLTKQSDFQEENLQLKIQLVSLQGKLQKLHLLEKENKELRKLLQATPRTAENYTTAEIIGLNPEYSTQQIIINQGSKQGVFLGQPLLDAYGIVGQVIQVGYTSSHVMLLTDTQSAIPVKITRNNLRAIAVGDGALGTLQLLYLPVATDIQVGDEIVSSGLGQRYPAGYPVGIVTAVQHELGEPFLQITVQPKARLQKSRLFLLMWVNKDHE